MKITCKCNNTLTLEEDIGKITRYQNKPPLKIKTAAGDIIKKEIFYYFVCPKCDREVVEIHRYAFNKLGNYKKVEKELLCGLRAVEYLQKTQKTRKVIAFDNLTAYTYTKGIPFIYFKTLNKETQRARYINEVGYADKKINSKVKVIK